MLGHSLRTQCRGLTQLPGLRTGLERPWKPKMTPQQHFSPFSNLIWWFKHWNPLETGRDMKIRPSERFRGISSTCCANKCDRWRDPMTDFFFSGLFLRRKVPQRTKGKTSRGAWWPPFLRGSLESWGKKPSLLKMPRPKIGFLSFLSFLSFPCFSQFCSVSSVFLSFLSFACFSQFSLLPCQNIHPWFH